MNRYPLTTIILSILLSACSSDINITLNSESMLVMNAKLFSGKAEHEVFLSESSSSGLEMPAQNTTIRCYVNDVLVAVSTEWDDYNKSHVIQRHTINADFKAGDKVKLEAESGNMYVYAENIFPENCTLVVDSSSVIGSKRDNYAPARKYSFKMRVKDVKGEESFYMAVLPEYWLMGKAYPTVSVSPDDPPPISKLVSKLTYNDYDPVFEGVDSPIPDYVETYTGIILTVDNSMNIFTDKLFRDDEHCFYFNDMDQFDFRNKDLSYFAQNDIDTKMIFRILTLSEEDYKYYCYLNAFYSAGELSEYPTTHSNVIGGTGQVLAFGLSEVTLPLNPLHFIGNDN